MHHDNVAIEQTTKYQTSVRHHGDAEERHHHQAYLLDLTVSFERVSNVALDDVVRQISGMDDQAGHRPYVFALL